MVLSPSVAPDIFNLSDELFPMLPACSPDASSDPENSPRRIAARNALERLATESAAIGGKQFQIEVGVDFSEKHPVFGAHIATRTVSAPAGAVVVGAIHKYPTLNILTKGKVLMASEHGKRLLEAPCMYMQSANVKKAGWVLEDCTLTNVFLMPNAPTNESDADEAQRAFHTTESYAALLNGAPQCQSS